MLHWREKSVQLIKVLKHLSLFLEYFHLTCDWRPVWLQLSQELCPFNNKYQMHRYWTEAVIVLQCFPVQTKSWSLCFLWLFFFGWVAVILLFWWDWLLFSIKAACSNLGQFFWFFGGFSQTCVVKFSYIFSYICFFHIYILKYIVMNSYLINPMLCCRSMWAFCRGKKQMLLSLSAHAPLFFHKIARLFRFFYHVWHLAFEHWAWRQGVIWYFMRRAGRLWLLQLSVRSASGKDFCVELQVPSLVSVNFLPFVLWSMKYFSSYLHIHLENNEDKIFCCFIDHMEKSCHEELLLTPLEWLWGLLSVLWPDFIKLA